MRQSTLSWILLLPLFILLTFVSITRTNITRAAGADHVVISEVQIAGTTSTDEFVELYNPTGSDVDLSNWQLTRKTQSGTQTILVSTLSGTIKSHGFYLATSSTYDGSTSADVLYSTDETISSNNTVLLYSDAGLTLIDKVGFGTAVDKEVATETNPETGTSRERRANSSSTIASMSTGADMLLGNPEDTDNNADDFLLRNTPEPQNSFSPVEPVAIPTATPTPTQEPTSTPTSQPTPTPTTEPTDTPTPTPTSEPTSTPTPTGEPTNTPTVTPTPTLIPTNTPVPTITPTITPTPRFPHFTVSCTTRYRSFRFFHTIIQIPMVSCRLLSN